MQSMVQSYLCANRGVFVASSSQMCCSQNINDLFVYAAPQRYSIQWRHPVLEDRGDAVFVSPVIAFALCFTFEIKWKAQKQAERNCIWLETTSTSTTRKYDFEASKLAKKLFILDRFFHGEKKDYLMFKGMLLLRFDISFFFYSVIFLSRYLAWMCVVNSG